jgi:2-C-methyl-D-erythritol 4-phosphate cytidylyltransferase
MTRRCWAVIVAAGRGVRMGEPTPKQFLTVKGRPLVRWSVEALLAHPGIDGAVIALPADHIGSWNPGRSKKPVVAVAGGASRAESVERALEHVPATVDDVLVHDGVRPLVGPELIGRLIEALKTYRAVIPGLPATDTLKEVDRRGFVIRTLDRDRVMTVQTPQAFRRQVLVNACKKAGAELARYTDCAGLVAAAGARVQVVPGDPANLKVTTKADLAFAAARLAAKDVSR